MGEKINGTIKADGQLDVHISTSKPSAFHFLNIKLTPIKRLLHNVWNVYKREFLSLLPINKFRDAVMTNIFNQVCNVRG